MLRYVLIARTVPQLGWRNVARVAFYRLRLAVGWRPQAIGTPCPDGLVFGLAGRAEAGARAAIRIFGWHQVDLASAPDWHADPFNPDGRLEQDCDWAAALRGIEDRDVKNYWELSRFYWLPQFALTAREGDAEAAHRIELWLRNWIAANAPYQGLNWACGQEASIRLMNLALTALILDTWRDPSPALKWLIETHARRIRPTLSYALGQDNNHGTAEACGLFIAGSWGRLWSMPGAARIEKTGRRWLNDRALRLIQPDGSPCQYSTTYHRANLEVLCMAGLWSAKIGTPGLKDYAEERAVDGARWLHAIIDPNTGDSPNLGANDGSHLFSVPETAYRDFRPTVALAAALFDCARPWPDYDDPRLAAFGIDAGDAVWPPASWRSSDVGGFHILRRNNALAIMHYPRFRFRPSQSDLLHVDLWHNGVNLLRDAGTFSYKADGAEWFSSTAAHNSIEFDRRDQMQRLGRFLYGVWLDADSVQPAHRTGDAVSAMAAYTDGHGARHQRTITLAVDALICRDEISGTFREACLRWRLAPGEWQCAGSILRNGNCAISIEVDGAPVIPTLGTTAESRYYQQRSEIPMATVKVNRPATLITKVTF